ncbi:MAG: menaquinone biosynthesis protein, partial [Gemmatimonadota bacterium]|nr:menaquinone biosynthesis protein [Gemmatimonadota bacterium]
MGSRTENNGRAASLKLGNIIYSNCFPVHARLIHQPAPEDPTLLDGVPSRLNHLLREGTIDVAPSSSIEYALNADRYRILPDLVIGSRGPVRSILFLSNQHPSELDGELVAVPTASATSVVLLKILLALRWGVKARFHWFDQAAEDPFATDGIGATAALFIGDVALNPSLRPELPVRLDLGAEWMAHTGLPFAFAVWQTTAGSGQEGLNGSEDGSDRSSTQASALRELRGILLNSRDYGTRERTALAAHYAGHFGMDAAFLESYWAGLSFDLDADMIRGLEKY